MLNGTVTLHRQYGLWLIKCEPHVAIRLKRLFSRIGRDDTGAFTLSDTLESSFDLSWFIDRYPMEMLPGDKTYLEARVKAYSEQGALVDDLLAGVTEAQPFELAKPARPYQRVPPAMTLELGGLLCADEIGLGKTIEAICCFTDPRTLPAVVVTLSDLPAQWQEKCYEFAPQLRTHIVRGITPYDLTQLRDKVGAQGALTASMPDIIIMNYEKLAGWSEHLAKFAKMVVFDEVQELRTGPGTLKYEAAKHLAESVDFRMGLSATPIYNYGGEFYNVMSCLRPDALGTRDEFLQEWCKGRTSRSALVHNPKAFGQYLRNAGFMIKRTAKEVGMELPGGGKPIVIPHIIGADLAALNTVTTSCAELAKLILRQGKEDFKGQKRMAAKEFNMKLRQATGIAKAPFVADFLRLLVESGEKPVLFGWHREFWSIILDRLKDLNPAMWTGSESHPQKTENKRRFLSGETPLFFCSLRAGAGLDGLQAMSRVAVVGELDYSPEVHKQNIGRVFRAGQEDIVRAYFLTAEAGSDPILSDILGLKKMQIEGVMAPEEELTEDTQLDPEHMKRLAEGYLAQLAKAGATNGLYSEVANLRG